MCIGGVSVIVVPVKADLRRSDKARGQQTPVTMVTYSRYPFITPGIMGSVCHMDLKQKRKFFDDKTLIHPDYLRLPTGVVILN